MAARIKELEEQLVDMEREHLAELEYLNDKNEVLEMELEQARQDAQFHLNNAGALNVELFNAHQLIHALQNQIQMVVEDNQQLLQHQAAMQPPPANAAPPEEVQGNSGMDYEDLPSPVRVPSEAGSSAPAPPPLATVHPTPEDLQLAEAMRETMKRLGYRVTSIYPKMD